MARIDQTTLLRTIADLFGGASATTLAMNEKGIDTLVEVSNANKILLGSFIFREAKDGGFQVRETKGACDAEFAGVELLRALKAAAKGGKA